MWCLIYLLTATALPPGIAGASALTSIVPAEPLSALQDEREPHFVPMLRERSKKELWLEEKSTRPQVHLRADDLVPKARHAEAHQGSPGSPTTRVESRLAESMGPIGTRVEPITTLFNIWTREAMPLFVGRPYKRSFQLFLSDHYTKQSIHADPRLASILAAAAWRFHAPRVDIVSGYRAPKYNLMLRKKGHQVARESQHTQGNAVDFRIHGVTTEALREFVRSLHVGGVGYYPRTHFIHADTGKVRTWQGS